MVIVYELETVVKSPQYSYCGSVELVEIGSSNPAVNNF